MVGDRYNDDLRAVYNVDDVVFELSHAKLPDEFSER
jgi:hypothetical protein